MRVPGAVRPFALLGRVDLRRAFVRDLPLKAGAVALTAILWVAVAESAPKDVTRALDSRVPIERPEVPAGYVLRGTLGDVAVKLRGPAAAVNAAGQQDLRATVDLSALDLARSETQDVPVRVIANDERLKVVEISPATLGVRVERLTARTLAVQARFANDPPTGFTAGQPAFTPAEVRVSGPQSIVATVAAAYVAVRFGDAGVDVAQSAQAQAVDASGAPVAGVQVEPAAVQANVPVLPTATTRTVPVLWQLRGTVAIGYWISKIATDPVAVTVRGDQGVIAQLDRVTTAPVDVAGLSANRSFRVPLALPAGVSLLTAVDAAVDVTVVPLTGTRPFPLASIQVTALAPNVVAEIDPKTVDVVLAGTLPQLLALRAEDVVASVDASGHAPGTYTADVTVRVPSGTSLSSVQPARATLTIRSK